MRPRGRRRRDHRARTQINFLRQRLKQLAILLLAPREWVGIKAGASKVSSGEVKEKMEEKQSGDVAAEKGKAVDDEEGTTQAQNKRRTRSSRIVSEDTENEEDDEDTIQAKRRRRDSGGREMVAEKSQEDEGADVDDEIYD